ncbi:MAG: transposase [Candidatus Yonathbacteria bacterium]|nr:transposase [Candidatus Yonathbacteria bacterium]
MGLRNFDFSIGEFYHAYNRGTDKRIIFNDKYDRQRFIHLLYLCNSERNIVYRDIIAEEIYQEERGSTIVDVGAYCLMPNHFHLLLHEKIDGGISLFMLKLLTAYATYFNKKYKRTGGLFEGKFKATHADTDKYLKYLFSYIHLNPVKIIEPKWKESGISNRDKAKGYLEQYKYSSYLDYIGAERMENIIINTDAFPKYFSNFKDFKRCVDEWLAFKD